MMVFTDVHLSNADTKNIAYNSFSGVLIVLPFPVFDVLTVAEIIYLISFHFQIYSNKLKTNNDNDLCE